MYVTDTARRLHIVPLKHMDGNIAWVQVQNGVYPLLLDDSAWITRCNADGSTGDELIMYFNLPYSLPIKIDQLACLQKYVDESPLYKIGREAAHLIVAAHVHFRNLPVGTPIPIYKLLEISSVASDVGTDPSAVATAVGSTEIPRPPEPVRRILVDHLYHTWLPTPSMLRFMADGTPPYEFINKPMRHHSLNLDFLSLFWHKIASNIDLLLHIGNFVSDHPIWSR